MSETKNFALEVIKRIHHELSMENNADKLNQVIQIIAEESQALSADIYVKADDVTLEHITGYPIDSKEKKAARIGEGVVGKAGADNRISFVKTKQNFQVATPLRRWNKPVGVLLVAYPLPHDYDEAEAETLETVCMFLSEFLSSEEMSQYIRKYIKSRGIVAKDRLKGTIINAGYGLGNVVVHRRRKAVTKIFAKDKDKEL